MDPYKQLDFFALEDQFSEDERMVRDTVRSWVSERFLPLVQEHYEAGTFPMELVPELAELGVFGSDHLPEEYGGAGLNSVCLRADLPGARARRQRPALRSSPCRARS